MSAQHLDNSNGNGKYTMNGHSAYKNIIGGPSAAELEASWKGNLRWRGITRPYSGQDVVRLRGSIQIEYTLARLGAERLWSLLHSEEYVAALGAMSGNQAVQQVKGGIKGCLFERLAGGGGRQPRRTDVPRPEPLPC